MISFILRVRYAELHGPHDGLGAVSRLEFVEQLVNVVLDRQFAPGELLGYFLVCPSLNHEAQHRPLFRRQQVRRAGCRDKRPGLPAVQAEQGLVQVWDEKLKGRRVLRREPSGYPRKGEIASVVSG